MSRLPFSFGIQNEWMTSRLVPRTSTGVSTGMTIWPEVTIDAGDSSAPFLHRVVELPTTTAGR